MHWADGFAFAGVWGLVLATGIIATTLVGVARRGSGKLPESSEFRGLLFLGALAVIGGFIYGLVGGDY